MLAVLLQDFKLSNCPSPWRGPHLRAGTIPQCASPWLRRMHEDFKAIEEHDEEL